jgi:plastocyanin
MNFMKPATLSLLLATFVACGGDSTQADDSNGSDARAVGSSTPAPGEQARPTGRIIEVRMTTDEKGNYFAPADLEAHPGDVLRFTLVSGVHNVHFTPELNPGVSGLPPMSDMLQLPGQTYDVPVTLPLGRYQFQCDPHAALGMLGKLEVEDDNS